MFKELGQLAGLMRNMGKIREEAERFQSRLGEISAEASSGGDMVTAKVNGRMQVLKITISEAAYALQDREMLEDLVTAAVNLAIEKVREQVNVEAQAMAGNMGLPPGVDIPGLA